jgi:hypothetical protein
MTTPFQEYVTQHKIDTRTIFQQARVRYAIVHFALRGEPILPANAQKIRQAVFCMTGVPYTGPFVLLESAAPLPVSPKGR